MPFVPSSVLVASFSTKKQHKVFSKRHLPSFPSHSGHKLASKGSNWQHALGLHELMRRTSPTKHEKTAPHRHSAQRLKQCPGKNRNMLGSLTTFHCSSLSFYCCCFLSSFTWFFTVWYARHALWHLSEQTPEPHF